MTRQDAVRLYEETTAPLRMENMGIRVRHQRTLQQIESLRNDYHVVNPGSITPITRAGLRALNADRAANGQNPLTVTDVIQKDRIPAGQSRRLRRTATGGLTRSAELGRGLPTIARLIEAADGDLDAVRKDKRFEDVIQQVMKRNPKDIVSLFPRGHKDRSAVERIANRALDGGYDNIKTVASFPVVERALRERMLDLGGEQQRTFSPEVRERGEQLDRQAMEDELNPRFARRDF